MQRTTFVLGIVVVILAVAVFLVFRPWHTALAPTHTNTQTVTNQVTVNTNADVDTELTMLTFSTADLPDRDPSLQFTLQIPSTWRAEYVSDRKAINIYQPQTSSSTTADTQLFIRSLTAKQQPLPSHFHVTKETTFSKGEVTIALDQIAPDASATTATNMASPSFLSSDHVLAIVAAQGTSSTTRYVVETPMAADSTILSSILHSFTLQ